MRLDKFCHFWHKKYSPSIHNCRNPSSLKVATHRRKERPLGVCFGWIIYVIIIDYQLPLLGDQRQRLMNGRVVTGDWWLDGESNISMHAWFSSRRAFVNNQFWDHFQHQWIWGEKNIRRGGIFKGSEPNRTKEGPSLLTALMCNTFNYCIPFARSSTLRPLKDPSSGNYIIFWLVLCLGRRKRKTNKRFHLQPHTPALDHVALIALIYLNIIRD